MSDTSQYQQSVSRSSPGCLIFLLDQSYSMTEGLAGSPKPKRDAMATAINRFISEMIISCEKGEEKPRHYFDVALIGYTTDQTGTPIIRSVLQGALANSDLVSVVDLYDNPLEIERRKKKEDDGAGGLMEVEINFPIWYKAPADKDMAGTPMCGALEHAHRIASDWCAAHPTSFPPIVIHLTDGEPTDGDPERTLRTAEALRSVGTNDGNLLMFNCHLSKIDAPGVVFPTGEHELPADDYARLLFGMSSELPEKLLGMAEVKGISAPKGARGMVFNADGTKMLMLISVGTAVASAQNLR